MFPCIEAFRAEHNEWQTDVWWRYVDDPNFPLFRTNTTKKVCLENCPKWCRTIRDRWPTSASILLRDCEIFELLSRALFYVGKELYTFRRAMFVITFRRKLIWDDVWSRQQVI